MLFDFDFLGFDSFKELLFTENFYKALYFTHKFYSEHLCFANNAKKLLSISALKANEKKCINILL